MDKYRQSYLQYVDLAFENQDRSPLRIDKDYFGNLRDEENPEAGSFKYLDSDKVRWKIR